MLRGMGRWKLDPFKGAFPLDEDKTLRVSALFKASGYRSYKNCLSRANDQRLSLGYAWSDRLTRASQKCTGSVLRGLAGKTRSEAFEFLKLVNLLSGGSIFEHEGAPTHPLPLVIIAATSCSASSKSRRSRCQISPSHLTACRCAYLFRRRIGL